MATLRGRLLSIIAVLALGVSACGGSTDGETAGEVVTAATVSATTPATSATTASPAASELSADVPTDAPTDAPTNAPTNAMASLIDALEASAEMSVRGDMRLEAFGFMSADVQFESDGDDFSMVLNFDQLGDSQDLQSGAEIRSVDDVAYVQIVESQSVRGSTEAGMPEGWFSLDPPTAAQLGVVCPSPVPGGVPSSGVCPIPSDNTFMIEYLTGANIVGQDEIDGTVTTQIRFTVDAEALATDTAAQLGGADGIAGDFGIGDFDDFGVDEFIFDAWIDGDGYIRRMIFDLAAVVEEFAGETDEAEWGGLRGALTDLFDFSTVINFYDYGADISIEAPPEDEIVGDFGDTRSVGAVRAAVAIG